MAGEVTVVRRPPPGSVAIGVVLINWNGTPDTIDCLESIRAASPQPALVVVVENASTDDSLDRLRRWYAEHAVPTAEIEEGAPLHADARDAWLLILRLSKHRGFSGGNNAGVRLLLDIAELSHFLLLNNDTFVAPDYFGELQHALAAAPDAGLLCGTIYEHPQRDRVWYAGGHAVPWRALVLHDYVVPGDSEPRPTEFVTGCALLISRRTVAEIGLLPEEVYFPIYVEDAEYSARAAAAGLPVLYAPRAVVYHKMSATTGGPDQAPRAAYMYARHRVFYVRRNLRGVRRATALLYLVMTKPARAALEVLRGRAALGSAILRGTVSGMFSRVARR